MICPENDMDRWKSKINLKGFRFIIHERGRSSWHILTELFLFPMCNDLKGTAFQLKAMTT